MKERKERKLNCACLVDIFIIIMATTISIWQNNTNYLWLLVIGFFTGGYVNE